MKIGNHILGIDSFHLAVKPVFAISKIIKGLVPDRSV